MMHRDRYGGIGWIPMHGQFLGRVDDPVQLDYYRERPQYDEGRDNGYVYTTAEHEDEDCLEEPVEESSEEEDQPTSGLSYVFKNGEYIEKMERPLDGK